MEAMLGDLRRLVEAESPSADIDACNACAGVAAAIGEELLGGAPERLERDGRTHLRWVFGTPQVAMLGHFDTVWPLGTLTERPFTVSGDTVTGPGVYDMKAGVVQGLHALAALSQRDGVEVLLTCDEEIASPTSRTLIEDLARRVQAVLVLEPSQDGALKIGRKGISLYRIDVEGRAAHAGLEPQNGVNALTELSHQVLAIQQVGDASLGTTATPTLATAGIAINVVPATASVQVDVRARTVAEQERVDASMQRLQPKTPGARIVVSGGPDRPPLEERHARPLFERARALASAAGIGELEAVEVGGGSDGNITAALGTPTLDGLGAVGGGAHAVDEHIVLSAMQPRTNLVRLLLHDLLQR